MSEPAVRVEGLGKVIRRIKAIEPDLVDELKAANRTIADDVTVTARTLAPKRSGRLAGSVRPGATARTGIVRAGSRSVPWAGPIHFGWARRNIEPDPFLYDALDERRDEVEERYLAAINTIADRMS
jgi:hypothetical protein